jgi:hypothetical protein
VTHMTGCTKRACVSHCAHAGRRVASRACEGCGVEPEGRWRRWRCVHCGKLVCAWCLGHVHLQAPLCAGEGRAQP